MTTRLARPWADLAPPPGAALQFRLSLGRHGRRGRAGHRPAIIRDVAPPVIELLEEIRCNLCARAVDRWHAAFIVCKPCWVKIDDYIAHREWDSPGFQLRFFLSTRAPVFAPWEAPPIRRRDFLFLVPKHRPDWEVAEGFKKIKLPPVAGEPKTLRCEWCSGLFVEYSPRARCCKSCFLWLEGVVVAGCAA